jgi:hypothetical protein
MDLLFGIPKLRFRNLDLMNVPIPPGVDINDRPAR